MLTFYGTGSIFPSHAWYLDGRRVFSQAQVSDKSFPTYSVTVPLDDTLVLLSPYESIRRSAPQLPGSLSTDSNRIVTHSLNLYPVLAKGAPSGGDQAPKSEPDKTKGPVYGHPNTVPAGSVHSAKI